MINKAIYNVRGVLVCTYSILYEHEHQRSSSYPCSQDEDDNDNEELYVNSKLDFLVDQGILPKDQMFRNRCKIQMANKKKVRMAKTKALMLKKRGKIESTMKKILLEEP